MELQVGVFLCHLFFFFDFVSLSNELFNEHQRISLNIDLTPCCSFIFSLSFFFVVLHSPISEIRRHLKEVDDVPLLVKLFTNSSPSTTREMLHVMQDNGEIVCVVGSAMRTENCLLFHDADFSMAVDCFPTHVHRVHKSGDPSMNDMRPSDLLPRMQGSNRTSTNPNTSPASPASPASPSSPSFSSPSTTLPRLQPAESQTLALSSSVNTMPCSLTFVEGCSMYVTVDVVAEARRLLSNMEGSMYALRTTQLLLVSLLLAANLLSLPGPPLSCLQLMWLLWCVTPVLSLTMIDAPTGVNHMRHMVPKNTRRATNQRIEDHREEGERDRDKGGGGERMQKKKRGKKTSSFFSWWWPEIDKDVFSPTDLSRFAYFALIRVVPTAVASLVVYCWTFVYTMDALVLLPMEEMTNSTGGNNSGGNSSSSFMSVHSSPTMMTTHDVVYLWSGESSLYDTTNTSSVHDVRSLSPSSSPWSSISYQQRGDLLELVQMRSRTWTMTFLVWCLVFFVLGLEKRQTRPVDLRSWWRCRRWCCQREEGEKSSWWQRWWQLFRTLNGAWCVTAIGFLCVQGIFCIVVDARTMLPTVPPLGLGMFVLFWPVTIVGMDEFVKRSDMRRRQRLFKRRRIQFDTKLGAWSPR